MTPPLPLILVLQVVIQEAFLACIPQGTRTVILSCWYVGLPAGWQISLPQGPALVASFDDLSKLFALPLFILHLQHDGTSHRASLGSGHYVPPTFSAP